MNPNISVIIPVKNEESKIDECLRAVFDQTLQPCEVIIVDGHSNDKTVENAMKYPVKVYYEDYHTRAGANNVGVENAHGDFIAFTDADCIPNKRWLKNLHREFCDGIAGVGGGIINIGDGLWEKSINLASDTFLGSANSVQGRFFKNKKYVKSISGCNCMYRKVDLVACGGFDVTLSTAEDTDVNNRMLNLGRLLYTPEAIILHNHKRGLKDFRKRMYQYGYGRAKSKLWDLQVIPPIAAVGVLFMGFISLDMVIALVLVYAAIISAYTLAIFGKMRKLEYLISVPIVYLLEHTAYMFGFWRGMLSTR